MFEFILLLRSSIEVCLPWWVKNVWIYYSDLQSKFVYRDELKCLNLYYYSDLQSKFVCRYELKCLSLLLRPSIEFFISRHELKLFYCNLLLWSCINRSLTAAMSLNCLNLLLRSSIEVFYLPSWVKIFNLLLWSSIENYLPLWVKNVSIKVCLPQWVKTVWIYYSDIQSNFLFAAEKAAAWIPSRTKV